MTRSFAALLAAFLLLSLTACGGAPAAPAAPSEPLPAEESPAPPPPPEPTAEELAAEQIEDLLASMTLEEQVGQLFFVRCPADSAAADVADYHLGGYILFGRDFQDAAGTWLTKDQLTANIQSYQAAAPIPLLIGVDEEGGTVVRASRNPNLRAAKFKSPQKLLASGGIDAVVAETLEKDAFLQELGINVNLAPVADVSTDPADFIYDRTCGRDADATGEYVFSVVSAMRDDGMGSVLKHFPGYGNNVDTHTGIAVDQRPLSTFLEYDFSPFASGIVAGRTLEPRTQTTAVLVSHNIITCMDADLPASLSPAVHGLLRENLGFEGVVMTDDLAMDAVAAYAKDGAVAVMALQAGNDIVLTTDYRTQIPQVLEAVETGTLDQTVVTDACRRVLTWKQALGLL